MPADEIRMTDADAVTGLRTQVQALTEQVSRLAAENATLRRVIVEREAAEAANKEKANASQEKPIEKGA